MLDLVALHAGFISTACRATPALPEPMASLMHIPCKDPLCTVSVKGQTTSAVSSVVVAWVSSSKGKDGGWRSPAPGGGGQGRGGHGREFNIGGGYSVKRYPTLTRVRLDQRDCTQETKNTEQRKQGLLSFITPCHMLQKQQT